MFYLILKLHQMKQLTCIKQHDNDLQFNRHDFQLRFLSMRMRLNFMRKSCL